MRAFRARIERGRIIVHEPLDLPDGVISLVPVEAAASVTRENSLPTVVSTDAVHSLIEQASDQRSSS